MTGEEQINFRNHPSIGTTAYRIRLIRSMAKITFSIQEDFDFEYIENRIFRLKHKGFVFSSESNDIPSSVGMYNESSYNK